MDEFNEKLIEQTEQMVDFLNTEVDDEVEAIFSITDDDINASLSALDSSNDAEAKAVVKLKAKTKKSMSQLADEIVAAYSADRSEANWKALMEFFWYGIKQFAYSKVRNLDDAYDMTIETFANAYEKFDMYDPNKAKFSTWLWSCCYYRCVNFLKQQAKIPVVDTDVSDVYDSAMLSNAFSQDINASEYRVDESHSLRNVSMDDITSELYNSALDEISNYKGVSGQILEMKLVKDMKIKDIAKELGMNESTVKNHLYKGKRNLERILRINHKDTYDMYVEVAQEEDNNLYA